MCGVCEVYTCVYSICECMCVQRLCVCIVCAQVEQTEADSLLFPLPGEDVLMGRGARGGQTSVRPRPSKPHRQTHLEGPGPAPLPGREQIQMQGGRGRSGGQGRVRSAVTRTRCAPLTQITQPIDMPHRPKSHRPTAQSTTHLFPFTGGLARPARERCMLGCAVMLSHFCFSYRLSKSSPEPSVWEPISGSNRFRSIYI